MARRPQHALNDMRDAAFIDVDAQNVAEQEEASMSEEAAIAAEMGEADGDEQVTFTVHKIIPESREKPPYVMEGRAQDLPITRKLQERFGGGKYHVTLYRRDGSYKRRFTLNVLEPRALPDATPSASNAANDPNVIKLLEKLVAAQTQPAQVIPPRPPMTPQDIAALVTAGVSALGAVKTLFAPQGNPLEMVSTIVDIAGKLNPGEASNREPAWWEVIGQVLTNPQLLESIQGIVAPAAQETAVRTPRLAAPQPAAPPNAQQAFMAQIQAQLRMLVTRAQANSDPGLYAELIIDNFPAEFVKRTLAQPGAIDFLISVHQPVATYRPWFEAMLTSLAEQVQGEEEPGAEGEPTPTHDPARGEAHPVPERNADHSVIFDPIGLERDTRNAGAHGEAGASG